MEGCNKPQSYQSSDETDLSRFEKEREKNFFTTVSDREKNPDFMISGRDRRKHCIHRSNDRCRSHDEGQESGQVE